MDLWMAGLGMLGQGGGGSIETEESGGSIPLISSAAAAVPGEDRGM